QGEAIAKPRLDRETLRRMSWPTLVAEGAVRRLVVTRGEAARLTGAYDPEPDKIFIELWLALATPPAIGESLVDQRVFERELARLAPDDDLILIGATGLYSFMGTEWRRSGVFDRIEIVQGANTIRLQAADYTRVNALRAPAAPELREIGLFRIVRSTGFDPTESFRLDLALARDRRVPILPPSSRSNIGFRNAISFAPRSRALRARRRRGFLQPPAMRKCAPSSRPCRRPCGRTSGGRGALRSACSA
ncbi:MAG: hypothetical protein ACXWVR_09305, partial [Rhodoplanes sp.]